MKRLLCLLLAGTASLMAQPAAPTPSDDFRPVVKIGVILPLTGDLAGVATPIRDAMLLQMQELRQSPTQNQYQLIFENNMGEGRATLAAAERLASLDRVDFFISLWGITGQQINAVAQRKNIPHLNLMGWNAELADGKLKFVFGSSVREQMALALTAFKKLGIQRPAILYARDFDCSYGAQVFAEEASRLGLTPSAVVGFDPGERDFRPILLKLWQNHPDALIHLSYDPEISIIEKTIKEMGWHIPVTNLESYDSITDNPLIQGRWWTTTAGVTSDFAAKYHAKYKRKPEYGTGFAYDAVGLIAAAYESAGTSSTKATPPELARYLAQPTYVGAVGPLHVLSPGILSAPPRLMKVENGHAVPTTVEEIVAVAAPALSPSQ